MIRPLFTSLGVAFFIAFSASGAYCANVLHSIDVVTEHPCFGIVLIRTKSPVSSYRVSTSNQPAGRIYVDLAGVTPGDQRREVEINRAGLQRVRVDYNRAQRLTRVVVDLQPGVSPKDVVHQKLRWNGGGQILLLVDRPKGQLDNLATAEEAKRLRDQGKKIVIIDPGHGWLDPGCRYYGMNEKTIVLDIGRKLAFLINQTDNMKAYLTREGDYLPVMDKADYSGTWNELKSKSLSARVEFARRMHGHVFISLHLNYCPGRRRRAKARGFEIYCLGQERSKSEYKKQIEDIDHSDLLAFDMDLSESSLNPETGKFLLAMKRDITTDETKIFVTLLKNHLMTVRGLVPRDPPIKTRGFRVLRTLAMPSALVEMAFLTNPQDARLLKTTDFRWRLARSLYEGIAQYFKDRSDVTIATNFEPEPISVPDEKYDIHVVQAGEYLFGIAEKYGTDVTTLQRINSKGRSATIYPGEELKVPKVVSAPVTRTYTVRTGDSLSEIARRHGMTVRELMRINRLKSKVIQPGDKLRVSSQPVARNWLPKKRRSSAPRTKSHKVRRGDTLYEIARKYHTTVPRLKTLNGMRYNKIKPGQKLRVPVRY